jgi:hypothetical protein
MSYKLSDILYETSRHFILAGNGYEVWENGVTHASRRGSFGSKSNMSQEWFNRAKDFITSRESA